MKSSSISPLPRTMVGTDADNTVFLFKKKKKKTGKKKCCEKYRRKGKRCGSCPLKDCA